MKTKKISKAEWSKLLGTHKLFSGINESAIKNYRSTSPVEVLNLIFDTHGVDCDGVVTLYPDEGKKGGYCIRVDRVDGQTKYHLDLATMPRGKGGFLSFAITCTTPEIIPDVSGEITVADLKHLPWLSRMKTALIIPTIGIKGERATSILFRRERDAYEPSDALRNVILTYAITNIVLNVLLRRQTDIAYQALDQELATIGRIQKQLLPVETPATKTIEWATHYATSTRAGGDYYDFFKLPPDRVGVIVADVSGHGSPAAVVMAMTRLLLHTYPGDVQPPMEVMRNINNILMGHILPGQFVTAFYGILDPKRRTLLCSSAGHCPSHLFRAHHNKVERIRLKSGLPLGVAGDSEYDQLRLTLKKGDVILFFTDGLVESFNAAREMYGEDRLERILRRSHARSADGVKKAVLADLERFRNGVPLGDDITLIVAKVTG